MSDPAVINYQPLQAMQGAWLKGVRSAFRGWHLAVLVGLVIVCIVFVLLGSVSITFYLGIFYIFYLGTLVKQYKNDVWQAFAAANGWPVYSAPDHQNMVPPSIQFGHSQSFSPVIEATLGDVACGLFTYQCMTGSGRYQQTHNFTVGVVALPVAFPHLLLLSKKDSADVHRDMQSCENLQLEGDFSDYFKLQIEKGQEVDALTIITPDVMQSLVSYSQAEDLEAFGNNLYFISKNDKRDYQDMQLLVRSVVELSQQIIQNHALATAPSSPPPAVTAPTTPAAPAAIL